MTWRLLHPVCVRTKPYARSVHAWHAEVLIGRLGKDRVRMIAEAFRPKPGGGFRSATVRELRAQLQTYKGLPVYLFDGPHYLPETLVNELTLNV